MANALGSFLNVLETLNCQYLSEPAERTEGTKLPCGWEWIFAKRTHSQEVVETSIETGGGTSSPLRCRWRRSNWFRAR